jgi:hypothetical protein
VSENQPTTLSAVFRRLSNDAPAAQSVAPSRVVALPVAVTAEWIPEWHGFIEPEPPEPPQPAPPPPHLANEDVDALLQAQPELAPPLDVDLHPLDDVPPSEVAAPSEPELPFAAPPPAPAIQPLHAVGRFDSPGAAPAPLAPPVAQPENAWSAQPSAAPPPVPPPGLMPAPPPGPPPAAKPHLAEPPAAEPPPAEPSPSPVAEAPLPAMDRVGRQALHHNRRLYRRVRLGAEIEIDGQPCTLIDVSIGGFGATDVPDIRPNTVVPVTLRLSIDGIEVGTRLGARIIYVTRGRSSGKFIDPSASQTAFLRYIVTWRGESVGTVGTTTLLDAITGGPDHSFPPRPPDALDGPKERWWTGLIGKKISPPR